MFLRIVSIGFQTHSIPDYRRATHITVRLYAGLRAWIKYIGVNMPSRPASAMAVAQRFKVSENADRPFRHYHERLEDSKGVVGDETTER